MKAKHEITIKMLYEDVVVFCDCGGGHVEYCVSIGETFEIDGYPIRLEDIECNDAEEDCVHLVVGKQRVSLSMRDSLSCSRRWCH